MQLINIKITNMKTRECPYCHQTISMENCSKYFFLGTNYPTICNHCGKSVKLEKEPIPFMYSVCAGVLSVYLPMNIFLYYCKLPFLRSMLYTLPFVIVCVTMVCVLIFYRLFFKKDE